jgi:sugar transferase (PEP-CTERM/EpsH1 system associated)
MSEILFLSHRVPYPPTKGDKIRSWHLLSGLARRCTVHLGTFVDDPADWRDLDSLRGVCGEMCLRPLRRGGALVRGATGVLHGAPLTTGYYRDRTLREWVRGLVARRRLDAVFVYSSSMAEYASDTTLTFDGRRVIDFCDVDSDKWRQYSASHPPPARWIYAREARLLERCERRATQAFDAALVSAEPEAVLLKRIAPEAAGRIRVLANGVDAGYFDPSGTWPSPYPAGSSAVVFTGAMDYHANVDAVRWFTELAWPSIRAAKPQAVFVIVGANPAPQVRALARTAGVLVTGRVADIRPYLAHAAVVVAPLRIARGVQNKVLEALAMARPVVATENAVQGIPGAVQAGVCVRDSVQALAAAVVERLAADGAPAAEGRRLVLERYAWQTQVDVLASLLLCGDRAGAPQAAPARSGYAAV